MTDKELGEQLVQGLKQLKMNLELLHKYHVAKNLDVTAPYTKRTEELLKLEYVNECLKGLSN